MGDADGGHDFYHGTSGPSLLGLMRDQRLDPLALDDPQWLAESGFYLATDWHTAYFVGSFRGNYSHAIHVRIDNTALAALVMAGSPLRDVPPAKYFPLPGKELFISIGLFDLFNQHVANGQITFDVFAYPGDP